MLCINNQKIKPALKSKSVKAHVILKQHKSEKDMKISRCCTTYFNPYNCTINFKHIELHYSTWNCFFHLQKLKTVKVTEKESRRIFID